MSDLETRFANAEVKVIEARHLLKLVNDFGGDATDAIEIIDDWLTEMPGLIQQTKSAYDEGDQQTVKSSAHTVKSAARSVGAMALGDMSEELQIKGGDNSLTADDATLIDKYLAMGDEVIKDLKILRTALVN